MIGKCWIGLRRLPRPIAIAIESLSKLAAKDSDRYYADCAAPGCHWHLMPRVDWYARDKQCHWCYRKIVPMAIAALPPEVTAPGEAPGRMVKVGSVDNIVNQPSKMPQNPNAAPATSPRPTLPYPKAIKNPHPPAYPPTPNPATSARTTLS